jgi:hypothetical protein
VAQILTVQLPTALAGVGLGFTLKAILLSYLFKAIGKVTSQLSGSHSLSRRGPREKTILNRCVSNSHWLRHNFQPTNLNDPSGHRVGLEVPRHKR